MNSTRSRFRYMGMLSLLLTTPVLAGVNGCTGDVVPTGSGTIADGGSDCTPADCAGVPAPADAKVCPGGTSVARSMCSRDANGKCGWEFPACPGADSGTACVCAGPAPGAPSFICADGSTGGPVCSIAADGTCGWQIRQCPTQVCPALGCFPDCPNGVLKDINGCDTCECAPGDDAGVAVTGDTTSCKSDADCPTGRLCGFATVAACAATGVCWVAEPVACNAAAPGCACDGSVVNIVCNGLPSGYAPAPLLHTGACVDSGPAGGGSDASACCPAGWDLYSCTYPDGGAGSACHNPQLGCASSTICGQGCDSVVTGRCVP
jgi:hypothetical protein